jgi:hypothetical protein
MVVVATVVDALKSLGLGYPKVPEEKRRQLAECEKALRAEK